MKKICFSAITLLLFCVRIYSQEKVNELANIQNKIFAGYDIAVTGDASNLKKIINELDLSQKNSNNQYLTYWQAYANYKLAGALIGSDKKASEDYTNKAIKLLDTIKYTNSEVYVLLGSLHSFSLNFRPGETAILSQKARSNYQQALQLDKNNLRAYYSIGRSDYYRPKQYGGGEITEANFLKALSMPLKSDSNKYAPTWGKMETYELLVAFYIREGRNQDALIYCKKGLHEFPDSASLKQQLKTLEK